MTDVVALGELLIDFTMVATDQEGYPTMAAHPGGAPANYLAALAKFGAKTALFCKVGNDAFGTKLLETLKTSGINTKGVLVTDRYFTTLAFVTLDQQGDRKFSFSRKPGADTQIEFGELNLSLIDEAKVFHFGTLSLTDEPAKSATAEAVRYAKSKGKCISFDPNLRKPLWSSLEEAKKQILWGLEQTDVLKISDDEVEFLFGMTPEEGAEHIHKTYGVSLIFVTCGAKGCYFKNAVACGMVPGPQNIQVKDTTGAGDIFGGSAMWKLLQTEEDISQLDRGKLFEIVRFACTAASLSTQKQGGVSSVPSLEEIEQKLKESF